MEDGAAPRFLRAFYRRLPFRSRLPRRWRVISFDHDEYKGRNVLSITFRDEFDTDEIPIYYEQWVFKRHEPTRSPRARPPTRS